MSNDINLTLEQYEKIEPQCKISYEEKILQYYTPNRVLKWRVDTLYTKEPDTVRWLSAMTKDETLLDIGANVGMYSILAAVGRGVRVLAMEPESQNYGLLNRNIFINKASNLITAYPIALSDKTGLDNFYLRAFEPGGSCHAAGEALDFNLQPLNAQFVQGCILWTLDDLIEKENFPVPTHIKIDVDGFEHKIINGMRNLLNSGNVKSVLIELNPHLEEHRALFDQMKEFGFSYYENQMHESQQPDGPFKDVGNVIFYRPGWEAYENIYGKQKGECLINQAFTHALNKIKNAHINTDPSPYFYIEDIFPDSFYQYLVSHLPKEAQYTPINETGMVTGEGYPSRSVYKLDLNMLNTLSGIDRPYWTQLINAICSQELVDATINKFSAWIPEAQDNTFNNSTLYREGMLIKDYNDYELGPHTDSVDRVLSLLFYLPEDDNLEHCGTSFYRPKDKDFSCVGGPHHKFENFEEVVRVPFKPNSVLGFVKTTHSFHGVSLIENETTSRDILGYLIRNPHRNTQT